MPTKVYGSSDDLVLFEGDFSGQVDCYSNNDMEKGVLVILSDGTLLEVKYGKNDDSIWGVNVIKKGELFDRIELCDNPDAKIYSDIVYLKEGVNWAYASNGNWEKVH